MTIRSGFIVLIRSFAIVLLIICDSFAIDYGKPAPNFSLQTTSGQTVTLESLKGKTVVLEFTDPRCESALIPYAKGWVSAIDEKFGTRNDFRWITIAVGAKGSALAQLSNIRHNLTRGMVLSDEQGKLATAYEVKRVPSYFVVNYDGLIVYSGAFDNSSDQLLQNEQPRFVLKEALEDIFTGKPPRAWRTNTYGCLLSTVR